MTYCPSHFTRSITITLVPVTATPEKRSEAACRRSLRSAKSEATFRPIDAGLGGVGAGRDNRPSLSPPSKFARCLSGAYTCPDRNRLVNSDNVTPHHLPPPDLTLERYKPPVRIAPVPDRSPVPFQHYRPLRVIGRSPRYRSCGYLGWNDAIQ